MKERILRRLPWWLKAILAKLRIIRWRPDCIQGLMHWFRADDLEATLITYDKCLNEKERNKVEKWFDRNLEDQPTP